MSRASRSWYDRGATIGQADSCRAGTHTMQTRVEGPGSKNIAPDEKIESFELDYDGKRNRWNEYIAALFAQEMERYEARHKAMDEVRKKYLKEQQLKKLEQKNNSDSDDADNDDGHLKEGLASVVLQEMALPKSKYEEDVYINNHTEVWGSWHKDHQWGYKCCKQFVRNSYCTSAAGIEASGAAADLIQADTARKEASEDRGKTACYPGTETPNDLVLDQVKLAAALKK